MRTIAILFGCLLLFWAPAQTSAHDYAEFDPIEPELRGYLIGMLEDARDAGRMQGDPETEPAVSTSLSSMLDTVDEDDRVWLETADYPPLEHPVIGRLPASMVIELMEDLVRFAEHAEAHGGSEIDGDDTAQTDFRRLEVLSSEYWGTR